MWAQSSYREFVFFKSGLSTPIRVSLIVAPDSFGLDFSFFDVFRVWRSQVLRFVV